MAGTDPDSGTNKPPVTPAADARPVSSPPDASPPDASPPDACVPMTLQLLANPGFESGHMSWTEVADPFKSPETLIMTGTAMGNHGTSVRPQTGTYAVWMGGLSPINESLTELVAVPADVTALRFKGYRWVATGESGGTIYDTLSIDVNYTGGTDHVGGFDNTTSTTAWTAFDLAMPKTYAGLTISLQLRAVNDNSNATSFYFDTLSLEATVCR